MSRHLRALLGFLIFFPLLHPAAARADVIDDALGGYDGANTIFTYLQKNKYKNVGVLRFLVQKGDGKPTLHADYLNDLMATRLENALARTQPEDPARQIGITRGATRTAASLDKKATFLTAAGRVNLFNHEYDLAWGKRKVKVDAFLTGLVAYSPDFKSITIRVLAFDPANAARPGDQPYTEVVVLRVSPDRSALRDGGRAFVTPRTFRFPDAEGPVTPERVESKVVADLLDPKETLDLFRKEVGLVVVMGDRWDGEKLVNEKELTLTPTPEGADLEGLLPDKVLAFKIKPVVKDGAKGKGRLGVFLVVNGLNSLNKEPVAPGSTGMEHTWWIMERGLPYTLRGYTTRVDDKTAKQEDFKVVLPGMEKPSDLGPSPDGWGRIELSLYEEAADLGLPPGARFDEMPADPFRADLEIPEDLALLREKLTKDVAVKTRVFVVPGAERLISLTSTAFDGMLLNSLKIRYYRPAAAE